MDQGALLLGELERERSVGVPIRVAVCVSVGMSVGVPVGVSVSVSVGMPIRVPVGKGLRCVLAGMEVARKLPVSKGFKDPDAQNVAQNGHDGNGNHHGD